MLKQDSKIVNSFFVAPSHSCTGAFLFLFILVGALFDTSQVMASPPTFEVRAFITSTEQANKTLMNLQAVFKGEYLFKDYIYHPKAQKYDLNVECMRLRVYEQTNWNQKAIELSHKIKGALGHSGTTKLKLQFDSIEEVEPYLTNHKLAFSYSRRGYEYDLGNMRIFVEDVQGLPPSVEVISPSKESIDELFTNFDEVQLVTDSVPKIIEKTKSLL